ncbi:MAG: hypothetical protein Q7S83_02065 [bacterium]|nr:hypothetical protein [bacterium]
MPYTFDDLARAYEELRRCNEWSANDSSNNPNKYSSLIHNAANQLRWIEEDLKKSGAIERTEEEKLQLEIDALHPNAKSRSVIKHNRKRYQIRYYPAHISRSGKTVMEWEHQWVLLGEVSS